MPEIDGIKLLPLIKEIDNEVPVIIMTGFSTVDSAVEAMKKGAHDYISKPFNKDELSIRIKKVLENSSVMVENRQLKKEEYYRAVQFIRLLQQLVKADYEVKNLSNVEKYYDRLIETPFSYRGLIAELEIIPYEKLWNLILSRL